METSCYDLILDRRSCRSYLPDPLPRTLLSQIVEAGLHAPTAMNRQLCRFFVITDRALLNSISHAVSARLKRYAGKDCTYGAPALVVVTAPADHELAYQDTACAMENMMLAAASLGVGSCWINQPYYISGDPDFRALFTPAGLGDGEQICASLALGMPAAPLFPGRKEILPGRAVWLEG